MITSKMKITFFDLTIRVGIDFTRIYWTEFDLQMHFKTFYEIKIMYF